MQTHSLTVSDKKKMNENSMLVIFCDAIFSQSPLEVSIIIWKTRWELVSFAAKLLQFDTAIGRATRKRDEMETA